MDWLLHKEHPNKLGLLIIKWKRRHLDKRNHRSLNNDKEVSTEGLLITSSNSRMKQFQLILLGNRLKTSRREHSFTNAIGKL